MRMTDNQSMPFVNRLRAWWMFLTTPRFTVEDEIDAQAARRLSGYLLLIFIIALVNSIIQILLYSSQVDLILTLFITAGLYITSLYISHEITVSLTVASTLALPFIVFLFTPALITASFFLTILVVTLLISSQFLSLRANVYVIGAVITMSIFFQRANLVLMEIPTPEVAVTIPVLVVSTLALLNASGHVQLARLIRRQRQSIDADKVATALKLLAVPAVVEHKGRMVAANDAALHLLDTQRENLLGTKLKRYVSFDRGHALDFDFPESGINVAVTYQGLLQLPDKDAYPVQIITHSIPYETETDVELALLITIQPRPHQDEKHLLQQIVAQTTDAMVVTDADVEQGPHVLMVNPMFTHLTGYTEDDLRGAALGDILGEQATLSPLDAIRDALYVDDEAEAQGLISVTSKAGHPLQLEWVLHPIADEDGTITHYAISHRDVTPQQALVREVSYASTASAMPNSSQDTLATKEAIFRIVCNMMADYAYALTVTAEGTLKLDWMAGDVEQSIGLSGEMIHKLTDWTALIHDEDRPFYRLREEALLAGQTRKLEYRFVRNDNTTHWVNDTAYPIIDEKTGEVVRVLCAVQDVTDRIEAQDTLKAHVVQQAVVAELGLLALNTADSTQLIAHASVLCEQVLDVDLCAVFVHTPEQETFVCQNLSKDEGSLAIGYTFGDDYLLSLAGYTLHTQEAVTSQDLADEPHFKPLPPIREDGYGSCLGVVISGRANPHGVLAVYSHQRQNFSQEEIYFLQAVANVLGTFVERNRAQAAEREQADFAEALREATTIINSHLALPDVLNKMLLYIQQVVPEAERVSILLQDPDTTHYRYADKVGHTANITDDKTFTLALEDYPLLREMAETQQVIRVNNIADDARWMSPHQPEARAYLGAPIIVRSGCIGFINIQAPEPNMFTEEDAERLQTFADKTGTAIVNARKQEELEQLVVERTNELNQRRAQFEAIFAGTGDGIIYSERGIIKLVNESASKLTGYQSTDLIGKPSRILIPDDYNEQEEAALYEVGTQFRQWEVGHLETRIQRKDGSIFESALTISRVGQHDEEDMRVVTVMRDVSRERALDKLKNRFIATAAHELRAPISSLKMRMYMIEQAPDNLPHHLERLDSVIERMNRLVNDLLEVASFEQGRITLHKQTFILQDLFKGMIEDYALMAENEGLTLRYEPQEDPIPVLLDRHRIEQVFSNLIGNAIRYTDAGHIHVAFTADKQAKTFTATVTDTGSGIPHDELPFIFEPFYRTMHNKKKGTGLGLSISRDIVTLHGGQIEVESELGKGSTFTVILPIETSTEDEGLH